MSRPRAATSVHNKMPFSALQKSKKVEVRFCCFCFPWISRQSTWMYLRSSEWYFTELHEEKKTITFFDRFLFKKEYKRTNLLALGTTQYPCCSPSLVTYMVQYLVRLWKWRCNKQSTFITKNFNHSLPLSSHHPHQYRQVLSGMISVQDPQPADTLLCLKSNIKTKA